jgi:hypothetical protein
MLRSIYFYIEKVQHETKNLNIRGIQVIFVQFFSLRTLHDLQVPHMSVTDWRFKINDLCL